MTASDSTSWTYTIPSTDTDAYTYVITYTTEADLTNTYNEKTVSNSVDINGGESDSSSGKISIGEAGVEKEVLSTTETTASWKVTATIPKTGLTTCVITDTLPSAWIDSGQVYDALVYGTEGDLTSIFSITGLYSNEGYEVSLTKNAAGTVTGFTITFYYITDDNTKVYGLQASTEGKDRDVVITYSTTFNTDWLAYSSEQESLYNNSNYKYHYNKATLNTGSKDYSDDATATPHEYTITKKAYNTYKTTSDGYPIYQYIIYIEGVDSDSVTITDVFSDYLTFYNVQPDEWTDYRAYVVAMTNSWTEAGTKYYTADDAFSATESGNTLTFTFTPEKTDNVYYTGYEIVYYLTVEDSDAYDDLIQDAYTNGTYKDSTYSLKMNNTATWGTHDAAGEVTFTYSDSKILSKTVSTEPGSSNGYIATFKLTVNQDSLDLLNPDEDITIEDQLSSNLRLQLDTVTVAKSDGTPITDFTVTVDSNNLMTIVISGGDKTSLVITYSAKVVGSGSDVSYDNTASISGTSVEKTVTKKVDITSGSSGAGTGSVVHLYFKKIIEGTTIGVANAVYQLYEYDSSTGNYTPVSRADGSAVIFTTDSNGSFEIVGDKTSGQEWYLYEDTQYCLIETSSPEGYTIDTTPIEFIITNIPSNSIEYSEGEIIYRTNTKETFHIVKVDEDSTSTTLSGAVFTLYSDSACTTEVATATSDADGKVSFKSITEGRYYLKETTPPTGYELDNTVYEIVVNADLEVSSNTVGLTFSENSGIYSATITNKKDTKVGTLVVNKSVTSSYGKGDTYYVAVKDSSGNYYDKSGNAYTTLQKIAIATDSSTGEGTVTFEDLPIGTYTVYEINGDDPTGYKLTYSITNNGTVEIKENETSTVTVTNNYEAVGSLTIEKTVTVYKDTNSTFSYNSTYLFTVTTGSEQNGDLKYYDAKGNSYDSEHIITLTMSSDTSGSVTVSNLPMETYTITEKNSSVSGYTWTVTNNGKVATLADTSTEKNQTVSITNTYIEQTSVSGTKTWVDYGNANDTRPDSITVYLYADDVYKDSATVADDGNGNWTYSFTGLDKYRYDAAENKYVEIVYTIKEVEGNTSIDANGTLTGKNSSEYTVTYSEYNITNTLKTGSLSVKKNVTGTTTTEKFGFTVTLTTTDDSPNVIPYTGKVTLKVGDGTAEEKQVENDGTVTFSLANGETAIITDIPYGVSYEIAEDTSAATNYNITWTDANDEPVTNVTGTIGTSNDSVSLTCTNAIRTGSLTITKTVVADTETAKSESDAGTTYDITVELVTPATIVVDLADVKVVDKRGTDITATAALGLTGNEDNSTTLKFKIKAGSVESVTLTNLPLGTYCVTENTTGETYTATYTVTANGASSSDTNAAIDLSGTAVDKEVTVTNTYPVSAELSVQKNYNTTSYPTGTNAFQFTLTALDNTAEGNIETPMPDATSTTVGSKTISVSSGTAVSFNSISYDADGTYYYKVTEVIPAAATSENGYIADGIQYDPTVYYVKVVVETIGTERTIKVYTAEGSDTLTVDTYKDQSNESLYSEASTAAFTASFENKKLGSLTINKTLVDSSSTADTTFYFTVKDNQGNYYYLDDDSKTVKTDSSDSKRIIAVDVADNGTEITGSKTLTNLDPGTYTVTEVTETGEVVSTTEYKVEITGGTATSNTAEVTAAVTAGGTTTVNVTNTKLGSLVISKEVLAKADTKTQTADTKYEIKITYTRPQDGTDDLSGVKSALTDGTGDYELTGNSSGSIVLTLKIKAGQEVTLSGLPLGTYQVSEVIANGSGYTAEYEVNGGAAKSAADTITISNSTHSGSVNVINDYKDYGASLQIPVTKSYNVAFGKDTFTFMLIAGTDVNNSSVQSPMPSSAVTETVNGTTCTYVTTTVNASEVNSTDQTATAHFASIAYEGEGTYTYTLKEVQSGNTDDDYIIYDKSEYEITVKVTAKTGSVQGYDVVVTYVQTVDSSGNAITSGTAKTLDLTSTTTISNTAPSYSNKKVGKITVNKTVLVNGETDTTGLKNGTYYFALYKVVNNVETYIATKSIAVTNGTGTAVTFGDSDDTYVLEPGDYKVKEVTGTGASATVLSSMDLTITGDDSDADGVKTVSLSAGETETVSFTNDYTITGKLTISKTVVADSTTKQAKADANTSYSITVATADGSAVDLSKVVAKDSDGNNLNLGESAGVKKDSSSITFSIKAGDEVTLTGLPIGSYTVTENTGANPEYGTTYVRTYKVDVSGTPTETTQTTDDKATVSVSDSSTEYVEVINDYPVSVKFDVTKSYNLDSYPTADDAFSFTLTPLGGTEESSNVAADEVPMPTGTETDGTKKVTTDNFPSGSNTGTFGTISYGADNATYYYKVTETIPGTAVNNIYDDIKYDTAVYYVRVVITTSAANVKTVEISSYKDSEGATITDFNKIKALGYSPISSSIVIASSFTNEKLGSLKVTKKVTGDTTQTITAGYTVKVTAKSADTDLSKVTAVDDKDKTVAVDVIAASGEPQTLTFTVKADQVVTLKNLPLDTYTVEETTTGSVATTYKVENTSGQTVTINKNNYNTAQLAMITNVYTSLKVTKSMSGTAADANGYSVTVTADDTTKNLSDVSHSGEVSGSYQVGDGAGNDTYKISFKVENNTTVTLTGLPLGTYTVTETGADKDGYTLTTTYALKVTDTETNGAKNVTASDDKDSASVEYGTDGGAAEVKITNLYTSKKTQVTVTKVWEDDSNNARVRPDEISVQLVRSKTVEGKTTEEEVGTVTLNATGNWTYTWTDLDVMDNSGHAYTYTVVEKTALSDYTSKTTGGKILTTSATDVGITKDEDTNANEIYNYTITNTLITGSLTVSKTVKSYKVDTSKKFTFTVTLKNDTIAAIESVTFGDMTFKKGVATIELAAGETVTATGIPAGIDYTVTETDEAGYTAEQNTFTGTIVSDSEANKDPADEIESAAAAFVNTYAASGSISLTGTKTFLNGTLKDDAFTFTVKENGATVATGTAAANGKITFTEIKYADTSAVGEHIYTITEDLPTGATAENDYTVNGIKYDTTIITVTVNVTDDGKGTLNAEIVTDESDAIAFTNEKELTSISGTKTWVDYDNADRTRPASITVNLLANGVEVDETTVTAAADGTWSFEFTGLPKYDDDDKLITYTVTEDAVDGYEAVYTKTADGYDITNTYTATTSISGTKTWADNDNAGSKRPASITVNLLANGVKVDSQTVMAAADGTWSYAFTGLDKYDADNKLIAYTVTEDEVAGYISAVSEAAANADGTGYTSNLTNTITSVKIRKVDVTTGEELPGATIRIVDENGTVIDEWVSTTEDHEVTGLVPGKTYTLIETVAPTGYDITTNTTFTLASDGTVDTTKTTTTTKDGVLLVEDSMTVSKTASISVTKDLQLSNGDVLIANSATFYVGLYVDAACTNLYASKAITITKASSGTVTFDNLQIGRTYYIAECDSTGAALASGIGTMADGTTYAADFGDGATTAMTTVTDGSETEISFTNVFYTLPDGFMKEGILTITKKLLDANGDALESSEVFYAGIFSDSSYTTLATNVDQNIVTLDLAGGSTASVEVKVNVETGGTTLYVTEVDADGNPVADAADFLYEVTVDETKVTMDENTTTAKVTITNQEIEEVEEESEEEETDTEAEAVQTGDETPLAGYMTLMLLALAVLIAEGFRRKKRMNR